MTEDELVKEIAKVLKISLENLTDESELGITPGWDSMAQVDIMMLLEESLGIEITEHTLQKYSRFSNILELVKQNIC